MKPTLFALCASALALTSSVLPAAPTDGFVEYFDTFYVQKPYDLNISDRFTASNVGGVLQYNCTIRAGDKAHYITSGTQPRTEMRWETNWTVTERMWEADVLVDSGTDNQTCIFQVKSNNGGGEPIYITVNNGNLYNVYGSTPIESNIIGRWFHMICAYNPTTGLTRVWINGRQVVNRTETHPLSTVYYFKNGAYHVDSVSRTHFRNVRFWCRDQTGLVQAPSFTPLDGTYTNAQLVEIWSPTPGASIRYTTDGSRPSTTSGTVYTTPIPVTRGQTITAIAYKSGMTASSVNSSVYGSIQSTTPQVGFPAFSVTTGAYDGPQTITMSSATPDATIRYTTDGSVPTASQGTIYTGPITVSSDTTLQAIAYRSGQVTSKVQYAFYLIRNGGNTVPPPSFSPAPGTFSSAVTVTLGSTVTGSTIRYTTDSSTPTLTTGTVYTAPFSVSTTTTIKAITVANGVASPVATGIYTIAPSTGTAWEAESLTRTASGATASTDSDASASAGARVTLNSGAVGNYVEFTLPNVPAGTYRVDLRYKTNANRGILNLRINGTQVGATLDQYASSSTYPTTSFGTVTLGAGNHLLRLTVTGKRSASSSYTLSADRIILTPATPTTAAPTVSPAGGNYPTPQAVALSTSTPGATIYYQIGGDTTWTPYTGPIAVSATSTIRAYAAAPGMADSGIAAATYSIGTPPPTLSFEAETLARTTSGASASNDSDASASGGSRVTLNSSANGSWFEFTLPNIPAGTYSLRLAYKTNGNRGQMSTRVDGALLGGTIDQYASSASYPTVTLGTVTFSTSGNHLVRFQVTGKNSASSSYTLSADKFTLVPQ